MQRSENFNVWFLCFVAFLLLMKDNTRNESKIFNQQKNPFILDYLYTSWYHWQFWKDNINMFGFNCSDLVFVTSFFLLKVDYTKFGMLFWLTQTYFKEVMKSSWISSWYLSRIVKHKIVYIYFQHQYEYQYYKMHVSLQKKTRDTNFWLVIMNLSIECFQIWTNVIQYKNV